MFWLSWQEDALSKQLIAAIIDNPNIKQGLFPVPGTNVSTAAGGGKKKAAWHCMLAEILFKDHPKHAPAYAQSQKEKLAKKKNVFSEKIRNCI